MEALAIIEVLGRNGEIRHRERLFALPAIIGRGFDADLILDDPHVAAHHLQIDVSDDGNFVLTDQGTKNGFSIPAHHGRPQSGAVEIVAGETVRLGHSQIRVWHPNSEVSPEILTNNNWDLPGWVPALLWFIAATGSVGTFTWIGETGPNRVGNVGYWIMLTAVLLLVWSGLWWLSSHASTRAGTYLAHLSVAAGMVFLVVLGLFATNSSLFAFNLHRYDLDYVTYVVLGACLAYGVYRHLRLVSRKSRLVLGALAVIVVAALIIPARYVSNQSDLDKIGLLNVPTFLRPPWMRVAEGVSVDEFLK